MMLFVILIVSDLVPEARAPPKAPVRTSYASAVPLSTRTIFDCLHGVKTGTV